MNSVPNTPQVELKDVAGAIRGCPLASVSIAATGILVRNTDATFRDTLLIALGPTKHHDFSGGP